MEEQKMKTAITIGVCSESEEMFNYEMTELEALCEACNIKVIGSVTQYLDHPLTSTYVGSGKIKEIAMQITAMNADYLIINDELSPATLSNIADIIDAEIMDRTMLILEIFKTRARTKEASLQVELANLTYMLPRLIGRRKNLDRTGGGSSGSAGATRGSGESQLELDRRHIENKIYKTKGELEEIVLARQTARKQRIKNDVKTVAFVGYTNAGKSSTINSILNMVNAETDKQVFVKDMLFATLETSTRRVVLNNNHEFLITDTVGFVNKLPHHLVESFKSTLEEITEASLIIHLIDASSPYIEWQIETTLDVLESLGAKDIPMIYVFNKVDAVKNRIFIPTNYQPMHIISNYTKEGLNELINLIDKSLFKDDITTTLLLPYTKGDIYNTLMEKANILSTEYLNDGIKIEVTLSKHLYELNKQYEVGDDTNE